MAPKIRHSSGVYVNEAAKARTVQEVVLGGRKYLLVPLESSGPPTPRPKALPVLEPRPREVLTSREMEIAKLVAKGRANKQIAAELEISEWTVSTHLRRIFAKLDVDTRAAMVVKCFDARHE
jgi:DNA-binding NarL/FixJ family response regulator